MNQETNEETITRWGHYVSLVKRHFWVTVEWGGYFLGLAMCLGAAYLYFYERYNPDKFNAESMWELTLLVLSLFGIVLMTITLMERKASRISRKQEWLINATNWTIGRIKANGLHCVLNEPGQAKNNVDPQKWPWGAHHTEHLGHLEAAALKWWQNYDPSEPDTAPINEMVADWLVKERGVSKDKARAIASILRADGLPAGRR